MRRTILWTLAGISATICIAGVATVVILRSNWFKEKVRAKIVSVAEQATGGRVEIGSFSYDWNQLNASVAPFILHGTEPAGDPPLFRADRIHVGLKIISVLKKHVDLTSLTIEKPQVRIVVAADGRTNFPSPRIRPHRGKSFVQELLELRIRDLVLRDGFAEYNSSRIPLDFRAHNLDTNLRYEAAGPRYAGEVAARTVTFDSGSLHGASFGLASKMAIENHRLLLGDARLSMKRSLIEFTGALQEFSSPHGLFDVKAHLFPVEVAQSIKLPVADRGEIGFIGKATFSSQPSFHFSVDGKATGQGLAFENKFVRVSGIAFSGPFKLTRDRIELSGATVKALDGEFRGRAEIRNLRSLSVDGRVLGFSIQELARAQGQNGGELNGRASGPVHLEALFTGAGLRDAKFTTKAEISPGTGGVPVQGSVELTYKQTANALELSNSTLNLGTSHLELSGTLGENLAVHATSGNLNDALAAFPLLGAKPPKTLPVVLKGVARFDGNVIGPLKSPKFTGKATATQFTFENRDFDRVVSDLDLTRSGVAVRSLDLDKGGLHVHATGSMSLIEWRPEDASTLSGTVAVRGADLKELIEYQPGHDQQAAVPITGTLSGTADLKGTLGAPKVTGHVEIGNVSVYDERADRISADLTLAGNSLDVQSARIMAGKAFVDVKASYARQGDDWKTGALRFNIVSHGLTMAQSVSIHKLYEKLDGQADVRLDGAAHFLKGEFRLDTLNSQASLRNITVDGQPYGNLNLSATTQGPVLAVHAEANLRGTPLQGSGQWRLEGDYPGHGEVVIPRLAVATLHGLVPSPTKPELPFDGFIEGKIDVNGPLKKIDKLKAEIRLDAIQINARQNALPRAGAQQRDLVLRNSKPVIVEATRKNIEFKSTEFSGTDTTIEVQGRLALDSKNPWDLRVNGSINLAILQIFNPDLLASGNATVNATVRGPMLEPDVGGRLELKNASLYMADLPNGLDQANGVILFDKNRATVSRLTAVSGGGQISFDRGSFVGFRGNALVYRVQGSADHVRYRSPEGVSVTVNAVLSLLGTSDNSVLSGTVTVMRAAFNPKTDVGSLLATTAKPISTPSTPNQYLRGIQYDIRLESSQSLEIETSLTRNIEVEANLRVRGTPDRPIVLGNISVTEGQIEFFGNKYTINRGEVNFYNASKIEPIIDMDLETAVRGITVDITFSGPVNKLSFSYRSDPPLQTNDIIALLAVGRQPVNTGGLASTQTVTGTSYLSTSSNALLGQAISAPVAGRLQRFFGVSHLKIDPQLTDLTSVPQARVTLEQQISKDITLTYITNLTRTQEQIIRVEWDLSRQWSVIALRDENGAFGIDFQYRKRFK